VNDPKNGSWNRQGAENAKSVKPWIHLNGAPCFFDFSLKNLASLAPWRFKCFFQDDALLESVALPKNE
jgi:hypothetical protein